MDIMLSGLALIGALSFYGWLVVAFGVFVIIFGVETEKYTVSTVALLIATVALIYVSGSNLTAAWQAIVANPSRIIEFVLGYLVVGVIWGVVKWFFFLVRVRDALKDFRKQKGITGQLSVEERKEFLSHYGHLGGYNSSLPPAASENKQRIIGWMLWWPFSIPWTLINDPIKRLFEFIYRRLAGVMQKISNRMFSGLT